MNRPPQLDDPADPPLASDAGDAAVEDDMGSAIRGKRIALMGRMGGMNRREASNLIRSYQGQIVDASAESVDWIVIGAEEPPLTETDLLPESAQTAAAAGRIEVIHETELWQRLGLVQLEQSVRQYHTPAMLANLLEVPVSVIRRWHRRGLIKPVRTLHRLPYFDFQEVATARRLAGWIASGASPQAIERKLVELVEILPDIQRPLDQLSILIEGKHVLLRQGEGLVEPGGQLRFDFDAISEETPSVDSGTRTAVLSMEPDFNETLPSARPGPQEDPLLDAAYHAEDEGDLETAVECLHAALARDGARADLSFQLGEWLYRLGQPVAARERYYMAIELDPEFVEARASLAGVLAELGQHELAIAAYQGALTMHDDYPDVQYNLASLLDKLDRQSEARVHWQRFLQLAPESPWASEAASALQMVEEQQESGE
ncbi:MAG: tetratricopeptide repeat protein [Planctomycetota bacterium]